MEPLPDAMTCSWTYERQKSTFLDRYFLSASLIQVHDFKTSFFKTEFFSVKVESVYCCKSQVGLKLKKAIVFPENGCCPNNLFSTRRNNGRH